MASFATSLAGIARSKLQVSLSSTSLRDTTSLHRWVLLKNSIVRSQPPSPATSTIPEHPSNVYLREGPVLKSAGHESEGNCDNSETFLFPDPNALNHDFTSSPSPQPPRSGASEAQWLDSLLESFSDDDDEGDETTMRRSVAEDDQDYLFTSPSMSPVASSEDLVHHSSCYEPPISVSYPIPYPPLFHPPIICLEDPSSRTSTQQRPGRPYDDVDELDDLPVPDAIDDTSDDDSDSLTTPSRSAMSFANPSVDVDPASIPLPPEVRPRVYIDTDTAYLYPFELDPLPFADDGDEYTHTVYHSEC